MQEKFYIFFDIDGVLNSMNSWSEENFPIDLNCLKNFADAVNFFQKKYEVHLIMSSSWRNGFKMEDGTNSPDVQNILDKMKNFNLKVEDKTPFIMQKNRADEINFYIKENNLQNFKCLAIDDTKHLFASKLAKNLKLYITDANFGFSEKDCKILIGEDLNFFERLKRFFKGYNY